MLKRWVDQGDYWIVIAKEFMDEYENSEREAVHFLSERLEKEYWGNVPKLGISIYANSLNSALSDIHWYDIAEALIADLD